MEVLLNNSLSPRQPKVGSRRRRRTPRRRVHVNLASVNRPSTPRGLAAAAARPASRRAPRARASIDQHKKATVSTVVTNGRRRLMVVRTCAPRERHLSPPPVKRYLVFASDFRRHSATKKNRGTSTSNLREAGRTRRFRRRTSRNDVGEAWVTALSRDLRPAGARSNAPLLEAGRATFYWCRATS